MRLSSVRQYIKAATALGLSAGMLLAPVPAFAGPVGYKLDVTTFYQFGVPSNLTFADFGTASPDTGYWTVTNNGSSTFSGSIGQVAVAAGFFGGDYSYSHSVTLNPGDSVTFAVNSESSNQGGYNGPGGSPQPGVQINLTGTITGGSGSEAVSLSVYDSQIHSGVINGGGLTDAYVLQGGNPFGGDYGDEIEVSQAPGHYEFFEAGMSGVPEPSSVALLTVGIAGLAGVSFRRWKRA